MKKKLAILGGEDLAALAAYHAAASGRYEIVGFFDDFKDKGTEKEGYPILGNMDEILPLFSAKAFDCLFVGVGYRNFNFRKAIFERFKSKIPFANIIHPSAYVDDSCKLGEGIFILPGVVLDRNVILEDNVLLNTGVKIAHDSKIGKHCFLAPSVAIAGFVELGECCFLGINTTIIDHIKITSFVQSGGGSVFIKAVTKSGLYVGNPVRFIR